MNRFRLIDEVSFFGQIFPCSTKQLVNIHNGGGGVCICDICFKGVIIFVMKRDRGKGGHEKSKLA